MPTPIASASIPTWDELLRLRVPARLLASWERLSGVPLFLLDGRGRCIAAYGDNTASTACRGCAPALDVGAPAVLACSRAPGCFHLAAPIALDRDPSAGVAMTGAWRARESEPDEPGSAALDPTLVPILLQLLAVIADEMRLFGRTRRRSDGSGGTACAMVAESPVLRAVLQTVRRIASTERTVLVTGETGTGKELVARALHAHSGRTGPFVAVNCGALADTLLDTELFGHARGAFTDAVGERKGLLEVAAGGTLFLDEVSSMSPALQAKLLRVLDQGVFRRVGSTEALRVSARIVAATNVELRQLVDEGTFREDLLFRLQVLRIDLPPLRQRTTDVPPLAHFFVQRACEEEGLPQKSITREAERVLCAYPWPGNVRELAHAMERAVIESAHGTVRVCDLPAEIRANARGLLLESESRDGESADGDSSDGEGSRDGDDDDDGREVSCGRSFSDLKRSHIEAWEREVLLRELERCSWNQSRVARELGMSRRKLGIKVQQYGLSRPAK